MIEIEHGLGGISRYVPIMISEYSLHQYYPRSIKIKLKPTNIAYCANDFIYHS